MEVHRCIVTRFEVEHPRTKIIRAEEMAVFNLLRARLVDLLRQIEKLHRDLHAGADDGEPIAPQVGLSIREIPRGSTNRPVLIQVEDSNQKEFTLALRGNNRTRAS
jgi:hypothetical protein